MDTLTTGGMTRLIDRPNRQSLALGFATTALVVWGLYYFSLAVRPQPASEILTEDTVAIPAAGANSDLPGAP